MYPDSRLRETKCLEVVQIRIGRDIHPPGQHADGVVIEGNFVQRQVRIHQLPDHTLIAQVRVGSGDHRLIASLRFRFEPDRRLGGSGTLPLDNLVVDAGGDPDQVAGLGHVNSVLNSREGLFGTLTAGRISPLFAFTYQVVTVARQPVSRHSMARKNSFIMEVKDKTAFRADRFRIGAAPRHCRQSKKCDESCRAGVQVVSGKTNWNRPRLPAGPPP